MGGVEGGGLLYNSSIYMQLQYRINNLLQHPHILRLARIMRRSVLYILLILAVLWAVFPLFWVLISSIRPDIETFAFDQTFFSQESHARQLRQFVQDHSFWALDEK